MNMMFVGKLPRALDRLLEDADRAICAGGAGHKRREIQSLCARLKNWRNGRYEWPLCAPNRLACWGLWAAEVLAALVAEFLTTCASVVIILGGLYAIGVELPGWAALGVIIGSAIFAALGGYKIVDAFGSPEDALHNGLERHIDQTVGELEQLLRN